MTTLHLVRHGQASFGADDYDQLSALGERQSRLLGEWMRRTGQRPTRVAMGPLLRHRQTAEHCLAALGEHGDVQLEVLAGLSELDHLDVLARHRTDFTSAAAMRELLAKSANPQREFHAVFNAALRRWSEDTTGGYVESWSAFKQRCIDALFALTAAAAPDESIWVFTSGGPIAVLVQHVLGNPDASLLDSTGSLVNCGVTRLHCRAHAINLGTFNEHAHLEFHNEPGLVTYR